jgi:hypothetical protein
MRRCPTGRNHGRAAFGETRAVVLDPSPEARVIATLAALGKVLGPRKKHRQGRAPPPRVTHALTALRCLVDRDNPLRHQDDAEPIDVD